MDKNRHEQLTVEGVSFNLAWRHYKDSDEWRCSTTVEHKVIGKKYFQEVSKDKSKAKEKLLEEIGKYLKKFDG